ncbi:hypothetical protein [Breznakiella homolactica]|uniref:Uncharacterized protein n=1 Tax=Breznakiella homolactica TaxID=2798577 RepID=A0A7T8BBS2_9SPIR|nr:hypothetical protein [Breznakiella homolactica]QQO10877.1 hypothetical protein JFL75_08160 [Breznakiella homolactica]
MLPELFDTSLMLTPTETLVEMYKGMDTALQSDSFELTIIVAVAQCIMRPF